MSVLDEPSHIEDASAARGPARMSAAADLHPRPQGPGRRVLVVDDHEGVRSTMRLRFAAGGWRVEVAADGDAAVARLGDPDQPTFDAVLCDLRLPGADGLDVLAAALEARPEAPVFVMTAYASIDLAVKVARAGARDLLQKPFEFDELLARIESECGGSEDEAREVVSGSRPGEKPRNTFVAQSASMREAVDLARRVAPGRSTVLVTGETGTGKELVAGLIHEASDRRHAPFVKVNCAALPETLLESELFGHERGAFTGADRRRIGRFEQANGGTLFLDEIGDMTPATQAKLLRVLQDQEFFRLGGTRPLRTDARIVAATNQDLGLAQREGRFRQDLYFRLDVIGIHLAPLRERPEDVDGLLEAFVDELGREVGREGLGFGPDAVRALREHTWPGNVRELRNVVERAVLTARGPCIETDELALERGAARPIAEQGNDLTAPGVSLSSMERRLVLAALEEAGFVQKAAAELLEVSPRKLNYMIRRMGITHASWRRNRSEGDPADRRG